MQWDIKLVLLCHCVAISLVNSVDDEVSALLSIKASLVDPLENLESWRAPNGSSHCGWTGVVCAPNGAVCGLDLSRMNLSGVVSDDVRRLTRLQYLNLSCNGFSSSLTKAIASLEFLRVIDVSQNFFVGEFPFGFSKQRWLTALNSSSNNFSGYIAEDIGSARRLEVLDLRGSYFVGSVPRSIGGLMRLKFLGLSGNNLSGLIPKEMGELRDLEKMILGYNQFEGGIPIEFGNLTNLKYLDLAVGFLRGPIPKELGKLGALESLFLYQNMFEGKIPGEIGGLSSLEALDLSDNVLSGEIPREIGDLERLKLMNLMCNKLSGDVPVGISRLLHLEVVELWNNSLSGSLPADLGRNSPLKWLDVSSNSFTGEIPAGLCNKGELTKLILFSNGFSGPIPVNLTRCLPLIRIRMQRNLLSGNIPLGFGKLEQLQRLELANNRLFGKIPSDLASSSSLTFLDLSRNRFNSSLPSTILSNSQLQAFIVHDNELDGNIPDEFQDCFTLSVIDLSSNFFKGTIPQGITSCSKLVNLNLKNNKLSGEIPQQIASMQSLAVLDLSNNALSGSVPGNLGLSPTLEVINISFNKLEGPLPSSGVLRTINLEDVAGNPGLCGGVLPPCGFSIGTEDHKRGGHAEIFTGWIVGISSVLALAIAVLGVRVVYQRYAEERCRRKVDWPWRLIAFQRVGFTTAEILGSLKDTNVVGMGATGVVYKAEIPRSSTVVAVKKLWKSETGNRDCIGEANLLGKLRHRNIVRMLGFLHNDCEMMVICEFMQSGNLGEALHCKQGKRLLVDWVSRYNVALGVAHGLAYLHHDCHPPVIHRDIKPNNILLDENHDARIADFGLARMMNRRKETVSTVAGSYGYIAPECAYTMKVDEKIDVFSYGVVLMELVTGRAPLDSEFGESVHVVDWIRRLMRENRAMDVALDQSVRGNCKFVEEEMLLVMKIALLCTAKTPHERPSMRDVITMLGEAKPRRKSSCHIGRPVFTTSPDDRHV